MSLPNLKEGDKVVCINPHRPLIAGKVYTVKKPFSKDDKLIIIDSIVETWFANRFRLATSLDLVLE